LPLFGLWFSELPPIPVVAMLLKKIALSDTKAFSPFFIDYIQQKKTLAPFYNLFPSPENFNKSLTEKATSFPDENRKVLRTVLEEQYKNLTTSERVKNNIASLSDSKTFTVTTGHQLNIFTGPLYFIYKIVTVINTCKQLKQKYPAHNFVPVYWMASEDHDYDEIKYFRLYEKKYVWETDQQGAVGRFSTKGIDKIINELPGDVSVFKDAYLKSKTLSDAVRYYVDALFGSEGLITIDADNRTLKSLFKKVIEEDIFTNVTLKLVEETNKKLEGLGYKTQVFCRDINFFYLDNNLRSRIEKKEDRYTVVDSNISFTEPELRSLIEREPEKFSPNVILRPLYQEVILPNLAYVGGPAEVIYWLQLKSVFDHFKTPFPALMPRNFAMVIPHTAERKFQKTGLEYRQLFEEKNFLFNHWVLKNSNHNLTTGIERQETLKLFESMKVRAQSIDPTLVPFVDAESKRSINSLEKIERKLLRAEKRLHADKLRQIEEVKDILFPGGSLQERTDNFLNFYQQDNQFIAKLIGHFDPFDFNFNVLIYQHDESRGS
jgi:bacillithiol biosynthesis cysteine-adding enzyme BshC